MPCKRSVITLNYIPNSFRLLSPSVVSVYSSDWIGYTPSGGILVPIPISLWEASGTATLANGTWSAVQGGDEQGPHPQPSTQFITWLTTAMNTTGNGESSSYGKVITHSYRFPKSIISTKGEGLKTPSSPYKHISKNSRPK